MSSPTLQCIIFADSAAQEPETNKWTLSGIFDSIQVQVLEPPKQKKLLAGLTPKVVVYAKIKGISEGDIAVSIRLLDPKKNEIIKGELSTAVQHDSLELVVNFQQFPVNITGKYLIEISIDGQVLEGSEKYPLMIQITEASGVKKA